MAGFDAAMSRQRETARAAGKFGGGTTLPAELASQLPPTKFLGYNALNAGGLEVLKLLTAGRPVDALDPGQEAIVRIDRTPSSAASSCTAGDTGDEPTRG